MAEPSSPESGPQRQQMKMSFTAEDVVAGGLNEIEIIPVASGYQHAEPSTPPAPRRGRSLSDVGAEAGGMERAARGEADEGVGWLQFVIDTLKQTTLVWQDLDEASAPTAEEFAEARALGGGRATAFAPRVFRRLQGLFGLGRSSFYQSWELTEDRLRVGAGRSGSLFFKSANHRFLLKTVSPKEAKQLVGILPNYWAHMSKHRDNTSLLRVFGLWWLSAPGSLLGVYAIVFNNLFYTPADPTGRFIVKFDLKGREPKPGKAGRNLDQPRFQHVFKDNDVVRSLLLPEVDRATVLAALRSDADFLCANNLMDYSLLVGIRPLSGLRRLSPHEDRSHALWRLIARDDPEAVRSLLLSNGIPPGLVHPAGGNSPLHVAVWNRREAIVRLLLAAGLPPGVRNYKGLTPLHLAAARGSKVICRELMHYGADVNAVSVLGNTPLHRAALHRRRELCLWLITRCHADPTIANLRGEQAFPDPPAVLAPPPSAYDARLPKTYVLADQKAVLHVGVIDFLCYFGYRKGAEYKLKRLYGWSQDSISVNPPGYYAARFLRYCERLLLHPADPRREQALLETDALIQQAVESTPSLEVLPGTITSRFRGIFGSREDTASPPAPPASPASTSSPSSASSPDGDENDSVEPAPAPSSFFGTLRGGSSGFLNRLFRRDSPTAVHTALSAPTSPVTEPAASSSLSAEPDTPDAEE